MKRFLKIALLVFYVFFNAGMSYSMHYCGDQFERINLFAEAKTCCESEDPMPGCCSDVSHLELPNTDQQLSALLDIDFHPLALTMFQAGSAYTQSMPAAAQEILGYSDSSPPLPNTLPIYILDCVFLI